mgnify:CR=1 FL=1
MHILEKVMRKIRARRNEPWTLWYLTGMSIEELNMAEADHDCKYQDDGYCGTCELIFIAKMRALNRLQRANNLRP